MEYANLLICIEEGIAQVSINRPKALNALNSETLRELQQAFDALAIEVSVRVIVLTGVGEKAFVAGADIVEMQRMNALEGRAFAHLGQKMMETIEKMGKPVIAAINGFALGGGCELAMACDIRLAASNAKFGQPEVNLGVTPGFSGTQRMARLIGKGRAKELIFTGEMIDAQEAYRIGLVNKVLPCEELIVAAHEMAKKIAGKGPVAISFCKDSINKGLEMDLDKAGAYEAELFGLCFATDDLQEGMSAFLEKRTANFKGC
jgi:enoyl-CoA hydratase